MAHKIILLIYLISFVFIGCNEIDSNTDILYGKDCKKTIEISTKAKQAYKSIYPKCPITITCIGEKYIDDYINHDDSLAFKVQMKNLKFCIEKDENLLNKTLYAMIHVQERYCTYKDEKLYVFYQEDFFVYKKIDKNVLYNIEYFFTNDKITNIHHFYYNATKRNDNYKFLNSENDIVYPYVYSGRDRLVCVYDIMEIVDDDNNLIWENELIFNYMWLNQ